MPFFLSNFISYAHLHHKIKIYPRAMVRYFFCEDQTLWNCICLPCKFYKVCESSNLYRSLTPFFFQIWVTKLRTDHCIVFISMMNWIQLSSGIVLAERWNRLMSECTNVFYFRGSFFSARNMQSINLNTGNTVCCPSSINSWRRR